MLERRAFLQGLGVFLVGSTLDPASLVIPRKKIWALGGAGEWTPVEFKVGKYGAWTYVSNVFWGEEDGKYWTGTGELPDLSSHLALVGR